MQKERVNYIKRYVPEEAEHVQYAAWSYMISMIEKINTGLGENCEPQLDVMVKELRHHQEQFIRMPWITEREKTLLDQYVF